MEEPPFLIIDPKGLTTVFYGRRDFQKMVVKEGKLFISLRMFCFPGCFLSVPVSWRVIKSSSIGVRYSIFPWQVMKYCARFRTTPIFFSAENPECPGGGPEQFATQIYCRFPEPLTSRHKKHGKLLLEKFPDDAAPSHTWGQAGC